ncbi:MAG: hypothetical protein ACRC5R_03680 [Mycoplasmatales bacterium]
MEEKNNLKRAKIDMVIGIVCKILIRLLDKPTTIFGSIVILSLMVGMIFFIIRGGLGFFKYYKW